MKKEEKSYPQLNEKFEDCIPKPQTIWFKLWKAKQEIEAVKKNAKNPHFKNNYADINAIIEAVEPVLLKYNLILIQPIQDGKVFSRIVDCENGDFVDSCIELPNITDPQKLASCVTYYRRYTLTSLMSLQTELDDDGNTASQATKTQKPTISQDRFEAGLTKVEKGEMTADAFKKALSGYELTELQTKALMLL
jgi:hypothetical protein